MNRSRYAINLMASLVLAIMVSVPSGSEAQEQAGEQNVTARLVIQVQELQDEVRNLRGRVEEQERELENLKQRQRDQYLDLDQRLSDQRGNPPMTGQTAQEPARDRSPETPPAEEVPEVRAPMETSSETVPMSAPQVASQAMAATAEEEKAAYDKAFQSLKDLQYADAAEEFQSFIDKYPNSSYADNAQYWLGESYYVTRNYDIALSAFQRLMDRFPDSPKVPDALLKVGYTYYELKQWDKAYAALTQVQKNYPDTTLARLAESRLRSMRMEGHY